MHVLRVYAASARAMLISKYWSGQWSRWTYAVSARARLVFNRWRSPCCFSKGCVSVRYLIINFNGTWAVSSRAQLVLKIDQDGTYAASARARLVLNNWQSPRCSSRGCVNVRYYHQFNRFNGTYAVSARAQLVLIIDHSRFVPAGWASML